MSPNGAAAPIPVTLGIIFSKDRALQLDACLASLARHVRHTDPLSLVVLYSTSSERFRRQYEELAQEYSVAARFQREQEFRQDLTTILNENERRRGESELPPRVGLLERLWRFQRQKPESLDCILFLVDDALFVGDVDIDEARRALVHFPEALGFSLRLGKNTTNSYVLSRPQRLPPFEAAGRGIVKYKWSQADGDFGYPLEVSSSLYRLSDLRRLARRLKFTDPNTLESQMAVRARRDLKSHPWMLCPHQSVAFSAPINRIQEVFENRAGSSPDWSIRSLADKFDEGLRIDVAALDGFVPSACHQEVEFSLVQRHPAKHPF